MARPGRQGVDYFPLDVYLDDKFKFIEIKYKLEGFAIIIKLIQKIYSYGYWYQWGDDEALLFSDEVKADIEVVKNVIDESIQRGIFNRELYDKYKILTSKGIQKRYEVMVKRRKDVEVVTDYKLIDDNLGVNEVIRESNVDIVTTSCNHNDNKSTQSKLNQTKLNESKLNNNTLVVDSIDYEGIKTYFNNTCKSLPNIKTLSDTRKKNIKKRIEQHGLTALKEVIDNTEASDFLSGRNGKWTSCSFDWIIKKENFIKIHEGNYTNKNKSLKTANVNSDTSFLD